MPRAGDGSADEGAERIGGRDGGRETAGTTIEGSEEVAAGREGATGDPLTEGGLLRRRVIFGIPPELRPDWLDASEVRRAMGVSEGGRVPWTARAASASRAVSVTGSPPAGASTTVVGGMGLDVDGSDISTSSSLGARTALGLTKGLAERC